jgi:hypothetical protein
MHAHAWSLEEFGGSRRPGCMGARGVDMHDVDSAKPFDFLALRGPGAFRMQAKRIFGERQPAPTIALRFVEPLELSQGQLG